ncbi:fungal-specific transcription factor domain-containing protein [Dactylonectria estremocensis]|uniref:Fungal-specific transcription factor domain-containing protein n=1 Tax=Dactylonectria estremocensis TaxID=1079267 RepID=A0A9P9EU09_9HYPO|nr:fungal-specific transcription factor domain-containing protein [Dactylonectria estremocensis]
MDTEVQPWPSASKACGRCHAKKVKCDQRVPQCSACMRQNEKCNIIDCVAYPFSVVQSLQDQIRSLQGRLDLTAAAASHAAVTTQLQPAPDVPSLPGSQGIDVQRNNDKASGPSDGLNDSEEIGILAIGGPSLHSDNKYVGSASGSTFARIFFKQLNLVSPSVSGVQGSSLAQCPSERQAALPPQPLARAYLAGYIARVHLWWPILQLPHLRRTFQSLYQNPRQCTDHEKFVVFIVLALASSEDTQQKPQSGMVDLNDSVAYFQTSLRFFNSFHDHPRDLSGIQAVMLIAIWMLNSATSSHCSDLWQLSRYIMSSAIEAGLHRHNNDWGFTAEELEVRNRTWWCAYNLERQVAVLTGRVLSVRDHAVHALLPSPAAFDALTGAEAVAAPVFHKHAVELCRRMITLRRISGRILESIYIARGPDGRCMDTTFQQICARSDEARKELEQWKQGLDDLDLKPSREYSEMKVEYCLLQLLLHRPSPTFMVPSLQMTSACSKIASSAIHQWSSIESEFGISAVCRCFTQLHSILLVGLAALYCDWQAMAMPQTAGFQNTRRVRRHENDTILCLGLVDRGIAHMKATNLTRYRDLFQAVRTRVYADSTPVGQSTDESPSQPMDVPSVGLYNASENMDFGGEDGMIYSTGNDMETYLSQVNDFLEGGMLDMDDTLNAWYDAVVQELQNQSSQGFM